MSHWVYSKLIHLFIITSQWTVVLCKRSHYTVHYCQSYWIIPREEVYSELLHSASLYDIYLFYLFINSSDAHSTESDDHSKKISSYPFQHFFLPWSSLPFPLTFPSFEYLSTIGYQTLQSRSHTLCSWIPPFAFSPCFETTSIYYVSLSITQCWTPTALSVRPHLIHTQ